MINLLKGAWLGMRAAAYYGSDGFEILGGDGVPLSMSGRKSEAGPIVSPETAMQLSAVWAATSATAQLVASLPCGLFEKDRAGKRVRVEDPLLEILFGRPNRDQTGFEYWEGQLIQQLMSGNAIARRLEVGNRLVGLEPLLGCKVRRLDGELIYEHRVDGQMRKYRQEEVLHLRGFGAANGIGLSVVRYGVQSLGAALAADRSAARVFSNGLQPSGVLQTDKKLNTEQREQLQNILAKFSGSDRAGKAMVLESGLEWKTAQWNPEDAQLLATRQFQVEDICRWFGIPPVIIGHSAQGQTMWGSGVEMVMLSWLQTGINPILRRIEERLNRDVVPAARRGKWFFKFDREAMLQMDSKAKAEFLSRMATSGTMTANERREYLDLPPHTDPAADDLLAQTALTVLENLGANTNG
ncbi:MAG: phage portal protein [Pseudomonadota bacterium]